MAGYVIAQINLKNKEGYKEYAEKVPKSVASFGGKYLVRAGEFKHLEGKWDYSRNVVIKFPTYEKALEWYNSDEYKPVKDIRLENSIGSNIIVKGI